MRPQTAVKVEGDKKPKKPVEGVVEEESKASKPKDVPATSEKKPAIRPQTAKPESKPDEKKVPQKKPVGNEAGNDEDDPIAKSLKERVAAGGITAVVGEKKPRPQTTKPTTNAAEEAKKNVASKPSTKPEEKKAEEKKVVPPKTPLGNKKPVLPSASNDDISDDPIA